MEPYQLILGQKLIQRPDGLVGLGGALSLPLHALTHTRVEGRTGYGKTQFMSSLAVSLMWQNAGVAVIDPAGVLARSILKSLVLTGFYEKVPDAFSRFIYLDVSAAQKQNRFFPFNILSGNYDPYTAADIILKSFKRVWPALQDGTATNIEMLVRLGSFVLASCKLPLLPYLETFLTDPTFHKALLSKVEDSTIKRWFKDLKLTPSDTYLPENAGTTLKRVYGISFAPVIRYALSQRQNLIDFNNLLGDQRSVAINLQLPDTAAQQLFGCLFTVQAETVAKSREVIQSIQPSSKYGLIVDEVHNFVGQSGQALEAMFAEARRANVALIVGTQYDEQLPDSFHGALTQCDTVVFFKTIGAAAKAAVEDLGFPYNPHWVKQRTGNPLSLEGTRNQYFTPEEQKALYAKAIESLEQREAYIRLPGSQLCKMRTVRVFQDVDEQRLEAVEQEYLRLYFRPKAAIDDEIGRTIAQWSTSPLPGGHDTLSPPQFAPQPSLSPPTAFIPKAVAGNEAPAELPDKLAKVEPEVCEPQRGVPVSEDVPQKKANKKPKGKKGQAKDITYNFELPENEDDFF